MLNLAQTVVERTTPFQLFQAQGLLDDDQLDQLAKTAPTSAALPIRVDDPAHEKQYRMNLFRLVEGDEPETPREDLPDVWAELLDDLMGVLYTSWLENSTGIKLTGLVRSVGVYAHRDGDFLAVHKDKPTKAITSIIYLNREWPAEAGGRFQLFERGGAGAEPVDEIAPVGGQLLAFPPTDSSWHAVSTIRRPDGVERLTVQVEYWLTTELMGTTYKPVK
jgi:hypothetical protein